ncbi:sulfotransferase family 2 domain-containing protein [Roseovarius salinarum]|uniref:sulfotransferase family 2 domain-containing protein n=1 Tax=Roseovarius salinarum TaxID=1981892 RepID=UPI000C323E87|nr:sulfotransferase family 2 domain-containing protein [Roseovarius salinarum]
MTERRKVNFLHIGKTAGNQIGLVAKQIKSGAAPVEIVKHPHRIRLRDLPKDEPYFFSIRHPLTRFVSGFYSRKRKGWPRHANGKWSPDEALAFETFAEANDLAEALFLTDDRGRDAFCAMNSVEHTAMEQTDWFMFMGYFLKTHPPVWIIRQEHFEADLDILLDRLDVPRDSIELSSDPARAHINPYDHPDLSQKAIDNLTRWYAQDIAFYGMCEAWLTRQIA